MSEEWAAESAGLAESPGSLSVLGSAGADNHMIWV